jgi:hypothetical protein
VFLHDLLWHQLCIKQSKEHCAFTSHFQIIFLVHSFSIRSNLLGATVTPTCQLHKRRAQQANQVDSPDTADVNTSYSSGYNQTSSGTSSTHTCILLRLDYSSEKSLVHVICEYANACHHTSKKLELPQYLFHLSNKCMPAHNSFECIACDAYLLQRASRYAPKELSSSEASATWAWHRSSLSSTDTQC